ncbi:hypothetical protein [Bradyrhizobium sp. SYSU BS000235]|uniref:hypothetical protein n=1 Tax=Bradyrhizobium sp. SYSU BS000235 TaxID=3411332 RepID=UPI003C794D1C
MRESRRCETCEWSTHSSGNQARRNGGGNSVLNDDESTYDTNDDGRLSVWRGSISDFRHVREFFPLSLWALPQGYGIGPRRQFVFIDGDDHLAVGARQHQDLPRSREPASKMLLQ